MMRPVAKFYNEKESPKIEYQCAYYPITNFYNAYLKSHIIFLEDDLYDIQKLKIVKVVLKEDINEIDKSKYKYFMTGDFLDKDFVEGNLLENGETSAFKEKPVI